MQSTQLLVEELQGIFQFGAIQAGKKLVVDRDKGIIKGVKIIGFNSQNGRRYLPEALKEAVPLYEGIKVNIDHPEKGPTQQRSSHDRFGKFINVRFVESEGIYGDLLYLKNHPLADSVCEAAEREEMNDVFGMSHNAQGEGTVDKNDIFVVSRITEVRHVDLVADPATTKSLTESQSPSEQETEEAAGNRVRYKSKRQAPGAKRKFVKAKSKGAKKPTGTLKESDDESEDAKEMHQMIMQILTKNDTPDDKKADEIVAILTGEAGDYDMEAQESVQEEAKVEETPVAESEEVKVEEGASAKMCEKCGAKMESMDEEKPDEDMSDEEEEKKAMKESIDPSAELAHYKTKDAIRTLCESNGVEFEESLVQDLGGLNPESLERQIKRIAAANLAAKPKCSPTQATFQESKEGSKKFPEGDSLFRWLAN
jgi:hypothetical protein